MRETAPSILAATGMPGVVVAVTDRDGHAEAAAFGLADRDTPLSASDVFRIGSAGKPLAALVTMRHVETGLSIDEPVRLGWDLVNPHGGPPITPRLLLGHKGGLSVDTIGARWPHQPPRSEQEMAESGHSQEFGGARPLFVGRTGGAMIYSSFGVQVAVRHSEVVTGTPYAHALELVAPGIYDPDTGGPAPLRGHMAFGGTFARSPEIATDLPGSAGMAASMPDLSAAYRGLLTRPEGGSGVVPDEAVALIRRPTARYSLFGQSSPYLVGLGVQIGGYGTPTHHIGHNGMYPFGTWLFAAAYPRFGMTVAIGLPCWRMPAWYNPPDGGPIGLVRQVIEAVALGRSWRLIPPGFGAGLAMAHHASLLGLSGPFPEPVELWQPLKGVSPFGGLVPAHVSEGLATMAGAISPDEIQGRLDDHLVGLGVLGAVWGVRSVELPHRIYAGLAGG